MSLFQSVLLASIAATFLLGAVQVNLRVSSLDYNTSGFQRVESISTIRTSFKNEATSFSTRKVFPTSKISKGYRKHGHFVAAVQSHGNVSKSASQRTSSSATSSQNGGEKRGPLRLHKVQPVIISKSKTRLDKIDKTPKRNETGEQRTFGMRTHRSKRVIKKRAKATTGYARTLREVAVNGLASVNSGVLPAWRAFQREMVNELAKVANGHDLRPFRLLIATSVSANEKSISNLFKWARYFESVKKEQHERLGFSDTIHFGLNHYDKKFEAWKPFMQEFNSSVALIRQGLSCKVMFWYELSVNITDTYDYIWLVDDDLDTTFLDWNLMRLMLLILRPLVAQTAIAPMAYKKRSSDYPPMKLRPILDDGQLALAVNERIAEVMAPIISAKLWPLVRQRLESFDLRSAWRFDSFWSRAATRWGGQTCGFSAPLIVIHASPLVHVNTRSIKKSKFKAQMQNGVVVKIKGDREGCIRRYIGNNQKVDKFRDAIIRPKPTSQDYDKSAHEVLVKVVAPKFNCTKDTLEDRRHNWKHGTMWTLGRIQRSAQSDLRSIKLTPKAELNTEESR